MSNETTTTEAEAPESTDDIVLAMMDDVTTLKHFIGGVEFHIVRLSVAITRCEGRGFISSSVTGNRKVSDASWLRDVGEYAIVHDLDITENVSAREHLVSELTKLANNENVEQEDGSKVLNNLKTLLTKVKRDHARGAASSEVLGLFGSL